MFICIIYSIEHFKNIVFNSKIKIYTDNANNLFDGPITRRVNKCKPLLSEYDYELKYIKGKENSLADTLSRIFISKNSKNLVSTHYSKYQEKIVFPDVLLSKNRNITDKEMGFKEAICKLHEDMVHTGPENMFLTLSRYSNIEGLKKDIQIVCKSCLKCNLEKNSKKNYGKTTFIENSTNTR